MNFLFNGTKLNGGKNCFHMRIKCQRGNERQLNAEEMIVLRDCGHKCQLNMAQAGCPPDPGRRDEKV